MNSQLNISKSVVGHRLHEHGLFSHVAAQKPWLDNEHCKVQLEFAIAHKNWTVEDWNKVLWSDELLVRVGKLPQKP